MARSVGELCGDVLDILQKTPGYAGFYTPTKVIKALQDSMDYVASHMVEAQTGGWLDGIRYIDTDVGQSAIPLPDDVVMIKQVRYLVANVYVPLTYDQNYEAIQAAPGSGITQYPSSYNIKGQNLYFNPPPGFAGPKFLQLEYAGYPPVIRQEEEEIKQQFTRGLQHYLKWRSCSILVSSIGKGNKEWQRYEDEWFDRMIMLVNKRVNQTMYIRDFEG